MTRLIQFWPVDTSGCGRYRCELPGEALQRAGFDVRVSRQLDLHRLCETDVVVGQRIHLEQASHVWQSMARDGKRTGRLVYELDDDVWALQHEKHNPAAAEWGPHLPQVQRNLAVSDAVTVSTWQLAEVVAQFTTAPVHVVPNAVPDELLNNVARLEALDDPSAAAVGWGGSATHDGDWEHDGVARAVVRWADRSAFPLTFLGHVPDPVRRAVANLSVHTRLYLREHGWTSDWSEYYRRVAGLWVGLAPLAPSTFNRSKSDLKVLEYAALGVPWIASDTGPYAGSDSLDLPELRGGLHARRVSDWRSALDTLVENDHLYRALVTQGRRWAATRTVSAALPQWREALGL